jgi:hypothetical protein
VSERGRAKAAKRAPEHARKQGLPANRRVKCRSLGVVIVSAADSLQQYGHATPCCQAVIGLLTLLDPFNDPLNDYEYSIFVRILCAFLVRKNPSEEGSCVPACYRSATPPPRYPVALFSSTCFGLLAQFRIGSCFSRSMCCQAVPSLMAWTAARLTSNSLASG